MTERHPPVRRLALRAALAAMLASTLASACYHYRVVSPQQDPSTEYQRRTMHSYLWGLVDSPKMTQATNCRRGTALDEVRVTTSVATSAATILSLGLWSPVVVEWRCSKPVETGGTIGRP